MSRLAGLGQVLQRFPSVRAVLLLAGVMVLATVVSTTALLLELRHEEISHARGEIATMTRVLSEQTARTFEGVSLTLRGIRERLSDDVGSGLELDSELVRFLLQARSSGLPQVKSIFVADELGRGVNSSRPDFIPRLDVSARPFFRNIADGAQDAFYVSLPEVARVDGEWTFYVSTRLAYPDGRFRGVLVAAINLQHFEALYESVKLDFVSRIQLLNLDGFLMGGRPHDELAFGKVPDPPFGRSDLHALEPGNIVEGEERFRDGLRLVAYRRAGDFPLAMRVAIDEQEALTPWRRIVRPIVAGVAVMLLFVLCTTFLLVRNLVRKAMLETELKESRERLQNYREEERTRIARELHDELGQLLTGIRMELSWLGGRLLPDQNALVDKVASVKGLIDQTIATVRRIASELRPLVLDDLGFGAAATWYVDQFRERTGMQVVLALPEVDPARGDAVASALFRVLQEALTNVARHADATHVTVRLTFADGVWKLHVGDDGVGFAPKPGNGKDIGLAGMRERAQNLGGSFSVISAPGCGTTVEVAIPVSRLGEGQSWKE